MIVSLFPLTIVGVAGATPLAVNVQSSTSLTFTNSPVTLTASVTGGIPNYNYTWGFGDGTSVKVGPTSSTSNTQAHSYSSAGNYVVTVRVDDGSSPSQSVSASTSPIGIVVSQPNLAVWPGLSTGDVGKGFTISVNASRVQALQAYTLAITYNHTFLTLTGSHLGGTPIASMQYFIFENSTISSIGLYTFSLAILGTTIDIPGSAPLLYVSFRFNDFGQGTLHLASTTLVTVVNGVPMTTPNTTTDGMATTGPRPPPTFAELVKWKAKPSDHNLVLSTSRLEIFTANVLSHGPSDSFVRVVFIVVSAGGNATTAVVVGLVPAGVESILSANWIAGPEPTRYFVTARLFYSGDGIHYTLSNSKTFSFAAS